MTRHRVHVGLGTPRMEDVVARANPLEKNVPSVELGHRARDARVRLDRVERLLVPKVGKPRSGLRLLTRFVGLRLNSKRPGGQTEGSSNQQQDCMTEIDTVETDGGITPVRASSAVPSSAVAAWRGTAGCREPGVRWRTCAAGRRGSVSHDICAGAKRSGRHEGRGTRSSR